MLIRINKIITIILILTLFSQPVFFSILGILGVEYEGVESSSIYVIYTSLLFFLSLMSYLFGCIKSGILKQELVINGIILFLIAIHLFWVILDPLETKALPRPLIFFILLGIPGFFCAATIIKLKTIPYAIKITEVLVVIIATGIIVSAILPSLTGNLIRNLAGSSYQALSYYSALSFGLLLFYAIEAPARVRLPWANKRPYQIYIYILLISCIVGTLTGGGRGALILLILYLVSYLQSFIKLAFLASNSKTLINLILRILTLIIIFSAFSLVFWEKDFIQSGFKRATQFINIGNSYSSEIINLDEGSSGRDKVYTEAIDYIYKSPFVGYGPFGILDKAIQGHNIFLDILLQFGFLSLPVFFVLIVNLIRKGIKNWSIYSYWTFLIFLYPMVMLMFSGMYLSTSFFIYGASFYALYKKD